MYSSTFSDMVSETLDQCDGSKDEPVYVKCASSLIEEAVAHFQIKLKEERYHGYLFDRTKATGTNVKKSKDFKNIANKIPEKICY